MKSPAVFSALKAQKKSKSNLSKDLPEMSEGSESVSLADRRFGWPKLRNSFLLIRGKLFPPTNPNKGELNHEA